MPRTKNLSSFVQVFDDALPAIVCDELVQAYESEAAKASLLPSNYEERGEVVRSFVEVNLMHCPAFSEAAKRAVMRSARDHTLKYTEKARVERHHWPSIVGNEEYRMKRYLPRTDFFKDHVDVDDLDSARRFLSFFWYLNTPSGGGGETEFYNLDTPLKIEPVKGRLVMFPPLWMFPHAGLPTQEENKYILSGYLHYV